MGAAGLSFAMTQFCLHVAGTVVEERRMSGERRWTDDKSDWGENNIVLPTEFGVWINTSFYLVLSYLYKHEEMMRDVKSFNNFKP